MMPQWELGRGVGKLPEWVAEVEAGRIQVEREDLKLIASVLGVPERELLALGAGEDSVRVSLASQARSWVMQSGSGAEIYRIVELCRAPQLPFSKPLKIGVLSGSRHESVPLRTGLHQYVYNIGSTSVEVHWNGSDGGSDEVLNPDDSMYVKPGVTHWYTGDDATLLVLRIGGRLGGDALHELSNIGKANLHRVLNESMPWFDAKFQKV